MANSRYEYVRTFEIEGSDVLLKACYIVVRIDGRGFHRFTSTHNYDRPNDVRGLQLMERAARQVMDEYKDIFFAYGSSDEFSFVFTPETTLYGRRSSKINSLIVSLFASSFVFFWPQFFGPDNPLQYPPCFDARCVLYPNEKVLKDYLSWRQVDCHINNLYNTCFWMLVQKGGLTTTEAEEKLRGTLSADKNELLFSSFGLNYNDLDPLFKRGCVMYREKRSLEVVDPRTNTPTIRQKKMIVSTSENLIPDSFWEEHPSIIPPPSSSFQSKRSERKKLQKKTEEQPTESTCSSSSSSSSSSS